MRRLWLIPIFFGMLAIPMAVLAGGGEGGFDGVVHSIESRYHAHATRMPFMGLVSLIAGKATHQGVSGLHVAEFDSFTEPVDGEELNRMVAEKLGPGWERIIRETSRRPEAANPEATSPQATDTASGGGNFNGQEQTLIFMRPEGQKVGLFVVDLDGHEMDVVQISVDPDHLNQSLGHYRHNRVDQSGSGDKDESASD